MISSQLHANEWIAQEAFNPILILSSLTIVLSMIALSFGSRSKSSTISNNNSANNNTPPSSPPMDISKLTPVYQKQTSSGRSLYVFQDIVESIEMLFNLLSGLALVSFPSKIVSYLFIAPDCTYMGVVTKLIGSGLLGISATQARKKQCLVLSVPLNQSYSIL